MISKDSPLHRITHLSFAAGMIWVLAMMLLTATDVTLRHTLSAPIAGSLELSEIMLALFGILGMAYTEHVGANVRVRVLEKFLPRRAILFLRGITTLLSLAVVLILVWQSCLLGIEEYHFKTATDTLGIKLYPLYYLLSLGCLFLALELFASMVNAFHGFIANPRSSEE